MTTIKKNRGSIINLNNTPHIRFFEHGNPVRNEPRV
jgi:hypothetical protein